MKIRFYLSESIIEVDADIHYLHNKEWQTINVNQQYASQFMFYKLTFKNQQKDETIYIMSQNSSFHYSEEEVGNQTTVKLIPYIYVSLDTPNFYIKSSNSFKKLKKVFVPYLSTKNSIIEKLKKQMIREQQRWINKHQLVSISEKEWISMLKNNQK